MKEEEKEGQGEDKQEEEEDIYSSTTPCTKSDTLPDGDTDT